MHSLLQRQIRRFFGPGGVPEAVAPFVATVEAAYEDFESDQKLIERSLELSSRELLQANADMRAVFQAFPDFFMRVDREGRILDCRGGRDADPAKPRDQMIGASLGDYPHPGGGGALLAALAERSTITGTRTVEIVTTLHDETRYLEGRIMPIQDGQSIVLIRDISERKLTEAETRFRTRQVIQAQDALHELSFRKGDLDSLLSATVVTTSRVLDVGRVTIWLRSDDRTRMACSHMAVHGEKADPGGMVFEARAIANYLGALSASRVMGANLLAADPRFAEVENLWGGFGITATLDAPIRIQGEVIGMVCHGHAGSPRAWLAEEQNFAASVADVVSNFIANAKRDHLEEQLRQSQKMEAIGVLAGGVAHDFNNLLTAIIGYSTIVLQRIGPRDPWRPEIEEIRKAGERAAALTRQLLAFSRKQVMQPRLIDLNGVVANMEPMLGRIIGEDVKLETVLDPAAPGLMADPNQLDQILLNLVVNAREAMPWGGRVTITTSRDVLVRRISSSATLTGPVAVLSVGDTGVGMDEATVARIFEPFFTTKGPGKGTGLGLSTVYGIVQQSHGDIEVISEPGVGTTFRLYFPLASEPAAVDDPADRPGPVTVRGDATILLVEDDDLVRALTRDLLEQHDFEVLEAANAEVARQYCREHREPIDLVLSDMVMPEINGRDLFRELVRIRPELRVLFMSGYAEGAIVHQGVLEPGTAFIEKPFTPDALLAKVQAAIDRPAPAAA